MITIAQTFTAIAPGLQVSFLANGGTPPYVYSVRSGGAGGAINSSTGLYIAPPTMGKTPQAKFDTIMVIDANNLTGQATIEVADSLHLVLDIIKNQLSLQDSHCYLWDQKIMQPTDSGLYVALKVLQCKPFGQQKSYDGNGNAIQTVNMQAILQIDAISRDFEARDRKEEILMALNSDYAQLQMNASGFWIAPLPPGSQFLNLSEPDGAAIPYRFNISVSLHYLAKKTQATPYYSDFSQAVPPIVTTES